MSFMDNPKCLVPPKLLSDYQNTYIEERKSAKKLE